MIDVVESALEKHRGRARFPGAPDSILFCFFTNLLLPSVRRATHLIFGLEYGIGW